MMKLNLGQVGGQGGMLTIPTIKPGHPTRFGQIEIGSVAPSVEQNYPHVVNYLRQDLEALRPDLRKHGVGLRLNIVEHRDDDKRPAMKVSFVPSGNGTSKTGELPAPPKDPLPITSSQWREDALTAIRRQLSRMTN